MENKGFECTHHDFVKSLDEGPDNIIAKQLVFMIGLRAIKKFSDENNGILPVEVTIHALKEEAKDRDWTGENKFT